jgi:NAD(P)-dependent dehydrogenase (short-subunit alcohol dehydrogenase family)
VQRPHYAKGGAIVKITAGQVAVVTGGTSGIGFGLAELLVRRGVHVMIADVREGAIPVAVGALSGHAADVVGVRADVAVEADVQALADATIERFGRVDLVCNNAGVVCELVPSWEQSVETWRWLTEVKLMGVVHGIRAFAPIFLAQGHGHFLNTASAGGLMALPMLSPYNAVMHAVVGLTETLHLELASQSPDLGATVLCPGLVATNLGSNSATLAPAGISTTDGDPGGDTALTPAAVAEAALAAVEAARVHAIVGPGTDTVVRQRVDALLSDLG